MTRVQSAGPRERDFGRFFHVDAGTRANAMTASVLSLLARRGLDPWRQAGGLAGLPRPVAVDELARVLAEGDCVLPPAPRDTAARLLHLSPDGGRSGGAVGGRRPRPGAGPSASCCSSARSGCSPRRARAF